MVVDGKLLAALFDIGSTLVKGPEISPAKYIARVLALPDSEANRIADIIMCREFSCWQEVCRVLASLYTITESQEQEIARLWAEQESAAVEIPGATEAVAYLKKQGFLIGLISNIWTPYYHAFSKVCRAINYMTDCTILSYQAGKKKPSVEILIRALALLNAKPHCSIMIGDTYTQDLQPAMEIGMKTVWVLSRPEKEAPALELVEQGRWLRPDFIINSIGELVTLDIRGVFDENNKGGQA